MVGRPRKIKAGDFVQWTNIWGGRTTTYQGRVAAVVPAGAVAIEVLAQAPIKKFIPTDTSRLDPAAKPSKWETYVVNVGGVAFWPKRTSSFQRILPGEAAATR